MKKLFSKIKLITLVAGVLTMLIILSCKRPQPDYPLTPRIEYRSFIKYSDGSVSLKFNFKDGDGDIGNAASAGPNFFFARYNKNGSDWIASDTFGYVVPVMDGGGKYTAYEGEIMVRMYPPFALPPASKFECWLFDRARHQSNKVFTDEIAP